MERSTEIDSYIQNNIDVFEAHLTYQRDSDDDYYFVGKIIDSARLYEPEMIDIEEYEKILIHKKECFSFCELLKGQIDYKPSFYLLCID